VSGIEQAYLQGLADYETALQQQLAAAGTGSELEAAYIQGAAAYEAALVEQALAEAALAEAAMVQAAVAETALAEAALAEHALARSAEAEQAARSASPEAQLEEAYQLGVAYAEAQQLIKAIEASVGDLSDELREAHEKGRAAYAEAIGDGQAKAAPSRSKSKS
jgi:hypothetical protein